MKEPLTKLQNPNRPYDTFKFNSYWCNEPVTFKSSYHKSNTLKSDVSEYSKLYQGCFWKGDQQNYLNPEYLQTESIFSGNLSNKRETVEVFHRFATRN